MKQILEDLKNKFYEIAVCIKRDNSVKILFIILIAGAILRYYGIRNAENTDEYNEVFEALRAASGKLNYERWFKKGYQNLLAVEYSIYFAIGYIFRVFQSPMDFATKIVNNMEPLFIIGRYTTATLGTLSVAFIYIIGRKIYNNRVGLIAASFLAVETLNVRTSHLVNTDVPLVFFFLLSLYFIVRFNESGKLYDYMAAAFLSAVTINIKIHGVGICLIFLMAHFAHCRDEKRSPITYLFSKEIGYSTIAFIIGLVISNPALVLGLKKFFVFYQKIYSNFYDEVPYAIGDNSYYTYIILLYRVFGLPLFIMTAVGFVFAILKRTRWNIIFSVFIITTYVLLSNTKFLVQNRYLMLIFPIIFLFIGSALDSVIERIVRSHRARSVMLCTACILLSVIPLLNSLEYDRTLTEENTSRISKRWIEDHIPSNSKILIDAGRTIISSGPRLHESRRNIENKLSVIRNLKEGETFDSPMVSIVDSYAAIYYELLLKTNPKVTYDITSTELGRNVESVEYYKKNNYEYFIHNLGLEFRINDPLWRTKYTKSAGFYDSIDRSFILIASFEPSPTRSGTTIKIYRIK